MALGSFKVKCECGNHVDVPNELPEVYWSYLIRKDAKLSEEQRKLLHQWESGPLRGNRLIELLLRLDRTDTLVASSIVARNSQTHFETGNYVQESFYTPRPEPLMSIMNSLEDSSSGVPAVIASSPLTEDDAQYNETSIEVFLQEKEVEVDDVESDDNYDHMAYDDDGEPLEDSEGEALIPYDPTYEYQEDQAIYLMAFANTYRDVRGKLQGTKIGRDYKVFKKGGGKTGGKKPPSLFKRKSKPKFSRPKKTLFNKKGGGKRGKQSQFMKRVKCFECGEPGHISRDCKKKGKGKRFTLLANQSLNLDDTSSGSNIELGTTH